MLNIIIQENADKTDRDLLHKILANQYFIISKIAIFMDIQSQINADVAAIKAALDKISADSTVVTAGIAALQAQVAGGTQVDLTQLDALAAQAATVQASVDATAAALTPASTAPAPATDGAQA